MRAKEIIGTITLIPKNKAKKFPLIDYTCSRNNIEITGFKNEHITVGYRTKRIGRFGKEKAMVGTFLGAKISAFLSAPVQLILFSVVMFIASLSMFKGKKEIIENKVNTAMLNYQLITIEALFVGILTGLVGVCGGFIIVPALVLLGNIPMKQAIGTSLLIITFNSIAGFISYLNLVAIDWSFMLSYTFFTVIGILMGSEMVNYVPADKLKKGFAIFLVFMSIFIMYKNKDVFTSSSDVNESSNRQ